MTIQKEMKEFVEAKDTYIRKMSEPKKESMEEFSLVKVVEDMERYCPTLLAALNGALCVSKEKRPQMINIIGTIGCMLVYQHKPIKMGGLQKVNGIRMWTAGCKREVCISSIFLTYEINIHLHLFHFYETYMKPTFKYIFEFLVKSSAAINSM